MPPARVWELAPSPGFAGAKPLQEGGRMGKGELLVLCLYQGGWDQGDAWGLPLLPSFSPSYIKIPL